MRIAEFSVWVVLLRGKTQNVKCSCCRETARHWMAVEVWPGAYIGVAHISSRVSRADSMSVQLITSLSTIRVRRTRRLTANSHRHARQDTHGTVSSCLVRRCELSRPDRQTGAFCVGVCRAAQCDRRTHSDAERTFIVRTRQDKTAARPAPASRPPPPRRRQSRQLRLAARPPTRSDVVRRTKCKHVVNCGISLNVNYFTKRHATRVIYRLTVQTLPDDLETQFTPPDTTQSCRVWRAVWTGH